MKISITNPSDFESCKNMIYKLSHQRYNIMKSKRPDIDLEDLIAEGMAIYCWCLKNYKESSQAKFTTYLYMNLRERLLDYYACTLKQINYYEDYNFIDKNGTESKFEDTIVSPDYNMESDLLDVAKEELSYEALQVMKFIISREWVDKSHVTKPTKAQVVKKFGYMPEIVDSIFAELSRFWNNKGWMVA